MNALVATRQEADAVHGLARELDVASTVTGTVISTGSPSSSSSSGGGGDGDLTTVAHWVRQVTAPVLLI